jgi:PST family polysaccharide transporter
LWWLNVAAGVLTAVVIAALGPALAWLYGESRLTDIAVVVAVIGLAEAVALQHEALLMRQLRFTVLGLIELGSALGGLLVGVGLALGGAGYWALVGQYAALATIRSITLWSVCRWRPAVRGPRAFALDQRLRGLLSYGLHHAGSRLLSHLGNHLDRILVGAFAGPTSLGLYSAASRLAEFPYRQLHSPLVNVAVAGLSRLQHDPPSYRTHASRVLQSVFAVSMPMLAFLIVEADSIVLFFLGSQWLAAGGLLRVLGVAWFALSVSRVTKWLYLSQGATRREFRWTVLSTLVTLLGVGLGAAWGATGVAVGLAAVAMVLAYPSVAFCLATSSFTTCDFFRVLWRPAFASLTAAGVLLLLPPLGDPVPAWLGLLAKAAILVAAYVVSWLVAPGGRRAAVELARSLSGTMPSPDCARPPLRAADWRFLLPGPRNGRFERLVLLGASPELMELVRALDLAETVSSELGAESSADAVVALHGARVRFDDVAHCLAPGGALYCEVNRRSPRHFLSFPHRIHRALRRAGLRSTRIYAVGPKLASPRVYLPLDVHGAFGWYLRTLFNPWTLRLLVVERGLRALTRLDGRRFAPFALDLAVTAVREGAAASTPSVLAVSPLATTLARPDVHLLMLSSTHLETLSQRVVILPFTPDATQPLAVLKVSKLPSLNGTLDREQQTLARIRDLVGPALRETLPEPLGTERWRDVIIAAESYRPGQSLQRSSGRWGAPLARKLDDLRLAAEWLVEFHRHAVIERAPLDAEQAARWVEAPIEAYGRAFGVVPGERELFARVRRYVDSLMGLPLPIVWRKPDFFGSNVLREGREVSVVDWESPELGPALCDLIRFVTPWSEVVGHVRVARSAENFRRLFLGPRGDAVSDAVDAAIRYYLRQLGMSARFFPFLLVFTWVDRALHHRHKQHLQGEQPVDARAGNRHIGRVEVLARHADQLFGGLSPTTGL